MRTRPFEGIGRACAYFCGDGVKRRGGYFFMELREIRDMGRYCFVFRNERNFLGGVGCKEICSYLEMRRTF